MSADLDQHPFSLLYGFKNFLREITFIYFEDIKVVTNNVFSFHAVLVQRICINGIQRNTVLWKCKKYFKCFLVKYFYFELQGDIKIVWITQTCVINTLIINDWKINEFIIPRVI